MQIQKRRLGKHIAGVDSKLSFDTFDLYLKDLETNMSKRGIGRVFKPHVMDQIKQFTAAITCQSGKQNDTSLMGQHPGGTEGMVSARY